MKERRDHEISPGGDFLFIGREQELNALRRLYNSDKFEFAVIYGRRRVGKTALISEFTKDKDTFSLRA